MIHIYLISVSTNYWQVSHFHYIVILGLNLLLEVKVNFMDDGLGKIEVFPDHFHASTPIAESVDKENRSFSHSRTDNSFRYLSLDKVKNKKMNRITLGWFAVLFLSSALV